MDVERPTGTGRTILLAIAVVIGVFLVVQWVISTIVAIVKFVVLVGLAIAVIGLVLGRKTRD